MPRTLERLVGGHKEHYLLFSLIYIYMGHRSFQEIIKNKSMMHYKQI